MKKSILIVEDEFVVANSLRLTLKQAGYQVAGIAASSEEADEYIQKHKPDLVLLDIRLNGKRSGIDMARILNAQNIAFIYLSANSSQKILEEAKKTEPYGFMVKPYREKDLLVALDIAWYRQKNSTEARLLQEKQLQKQLQEIADDTSSDARGKFLRITRALRVFVPFDLIVSGNGQLHSDQFTDSAYLRIGFDEFQYIGEQEFMTIAGLDKNGLVKSYPAESVDQMWQDCFKMESKLIFQLELSTGTVVQYSFYSRQRDLYTEKHTAILKLFSSCLTKVTEKMVLTESAVHSKTPVVGRPDHEESGHLEFNGIIGNHPLLLAALDLTKQVAQYNTSVLILGESGTGKEKVARSIHSISPRSDAPFIEVNCGAIPPTLIESELFGHERGAFTGATERRKGRFEQAEGGTIFLDEIGELPLEMQAKLLRVLQEKEINHVGSNVPRKVDVRIVAATNRVLEKEVADGRFRLDLYYRLNVFPITLPPLRDRKSDIPALASFFANKFCKEFNKDFNGISPSMTEEMDAYHWPGNIRELENVLERSVILNDGKSALHLKQNLIGKTAEPLEVSYVETLDDVRRLQRETEKAYLVSILKKAQGRIRGTGGAAELLNIKPTTLESKIAKLGIVKGDISGWGS
ncbi:Response regulator receiver domain-containing protein [Pedobacter westerhofensis]|uniref:Response regulator receiver domain-containing protein n=1 Tax=Pedobacter westerhofensis TaxID=425512 RepID=A0A521FT70_9SPHI|nr:sigma 54-interacting response regulator [Pedobacter westerhofensis]SMO99368.1 Response regulator receiver domain-containing protein [Pedobacter westerhofensis]